MKISYVFLTGEIVEVEVSDSLGKVFSEIRREAHNSNRKTWGNKSYDYFC